MAASFSLSWMLNATLMGLLLAVGTATAAPTAGDVAIVNFALNLECLEAEFYSYAAFGRGLSAANRGGGPAPTGGRKAQLSKSIHAYAMDIAYDEIKHVAFLRVALGDAAIACPQIDIGKVFGVLADLAYNMTLNPPFSPYKDDAAFLLGSFLFEDVGVTAYRGAIPLISDKGILGAAASLLGTEAYHAGAIRTLILEAGYESMPKGAILFGGVVDAANNVSNLRDVVDGSSKDLDQGVTHPTGANNLVPADANALIYARSVKEVTKIVAAFFPKGLNA